MIRSTCVACIVLCHTALAASDHCGSGKYRNMKNIATTSAVKCDSCPKGYFQPNKGEGYYNPTVCTECPVGYFSGNGWANCAVKCPPGSKQLDGKQCETCALGKYQSEAGQKTCSTCPGGKFSNLYDCEICPGGKYSKSGASICPDCPKNGWSEDESETCEECTWCLPGACMPKKDNEYCKECTWGKTSITAILSINRKVYDDENYEDQLVMNSIYNKATVMAESCNACCLKQSVSCVDKPVSSKTLADSQMTVLGGQQLEALNTGMCTYWLEERKCSTDLSNKQVCKTELDLQQLVSAAPKTVFSFGTLIAFSVLVLTASEVLW